MSPRDVKQADFDRCLIAWQLDPFGERASQARTPQEGLAIILEAYREAACISANRAHLLLAEDLRRRAMTPEEISAWLKRWFDQDRASILSIAAPADVAARRETAFSTAYWSRLRQLLNGPVPLAGGRS